MPLQNYRHNPLPSIWHRPLPTRHKLSREERVQVHARALRFNARHSQHQRIMRVLKAWGPLFTLAHKRERARNKVRRQVRQQRKKLPLSVWQVAIGQALDEKHNPESAGTALSMVAEEGDEEEDNDYAPRAGTPSSAEESDSPSEEEKEEDLENTEDVDRNALKLGKRTKEKHDRKERKVCRAAAKEQHLERKFLKTLKAQDSNDSDDEEMFTNLLLAGNTKGEKSTSDSRAEEGDSDGKEATSEEECSPALAAPTPGKTPSFSAPRPTRAPSLDSARKLEKKASSVPSKRIQPMLLTPSKSSPSRRIQPTLIQAIDLPSDDSEDEDYIPDDTIRSADNDLSGDDGLSDAVLALKARLGERVESGSGYDSALGAGSHSESENAADEDGKAEGGDVSIAAGPSDETIRDAGDESMQDTSMETANSVDV